MNGWPRNTATDAEDSMCKLCLSIRATSTTTAICSMHSRCLQRTPPTPMDADEQQTYLRTVIEAWEKPCDSPCNKITSEHSDDVVVQGQPGVHLCNGTVESKRRIFLSDSPPLLCFRLHEFSGQIRSLAGVPADIEVADHRFALTAATFYDGGHYTAAIAPDGEHWFAYDGLPDDVEDRLQMHADRSTIYTDRTVNHVLYVNHAFRFRRW